MPERVTHQNIKQRNRWWGLHALPSYAFSNCLRNSRFFHIYHRHIFRLYHVLSSYVILYWLRSSRFIHIYHRQILRLYHELSGGVNPFHQRNRTFVYIHHKVYFGISWTLRMWLLTLSFHVDLNSHLIQSYFDTIMSTLHGLIQCVS